MDLILLPNQLFPIAQIKKMIPDLTKIFLIEEPRYFTDFRFHKLKLTYHRATMKYYADNLKDLGINSQYIDYYDIDYAVLNRSNMIYFNPIDHKLHNKYASLLSKAKMLPNFSFMISPHEIMENKGIFYNNNKYSFSKWYAFQRKRTATLLENGKPIGGKWSYDSENRKKFPKGIIIPSNLDIIQNKWYAKGYKYINDHFPENYGNNTKWIYPINTNSAKQYFKHFLKNKLANFGKWQDAISSGDNHVLFHSCISVILNIGLITEAMALSMTMKYYNKNKESIPLSSIEGFIRQLIGWRGYCYAIYLLEPNMYSLNYFDYRGIISDNYWSKIGIDPIDNCIDSMKNSGYLHHIERLMIIGNWFLLNRKDPKEVHRIFMEWSIDGYDWVMTPNIMGMSQYADGGMMMTRPYFSSSAYILRMSDYKKGIWAQIWDAKYYSFIVDNIDMLRKNYATAMQVRHYSNKTPAEKASLAEIDNKFKY